MGGIFRVIEAQGQWLPECDVTIVDSLDNADVVSMHAGEVVNTDLPIAVSNHGLYWTADLEWHKEFWAYNNSVIEALRRAHKIIVPSEWVAVPIRRDMRKSPIVIPHGINGEDFTPPNEYGNYVMWAKPRVDVVSDPRPVNELAALCTDIKFRTTFGKKAPNVAVMGVMVASDFQDMLKHAAVWLATTRETGDIATREAMAWGLPTLAWDWGGTGELIIHKETGWLSPPGDYEHLAEGLRYCIANRDKLGKAARDDVLKRFQWKDLMGQYAAVYRDAISSDVYEKDISIVVPAYNYGHFLPECLDSIQNIDADVEIIVVNDASTDNTIEILSARKESLIVINHENNMGLPASLNTGHRAARGKYIVNLDADNLLLPDGLNELYRSLESKPHIDIATAPYTILNTNRVEHCHGGESIDVRGQLAHYNQIPSTCMIRSRVVKQIGGYRRRQVKNEDAEYWCRALSMGLRAERVTDVPVFAYRWHGENKSALEGGEDDPESPLSWNFYYPWRKLPDITPFAMLGNPKNLSWAVRSYDNPTVSVVVPCGPGHEKYLMDALDGIASQTFTDFECVVVNDTGSPLDVAGMGHPWVRVINTSGSVGPAIARNTGIEAARGKLILPVDADDLLYPGILKEYYSAFCKYPDSIVYGDFFTEDKIGDREDYPVGPWSMKRVLEQALYADVILFAKSWWRAVGGYPVETPWEDWIFGVLMHMIGVGATYVQKPWGVYRHWTRLSTGQSKSDGDNEGYNTPSFQDRLQEARDWMSDREKELKKMCKHCGNGKGRTISNKTVRDPTVAAAMRIGTDLTIVCTRAGTGYISVNSKAVRGRKYRVKSGTVFTVPPGDAWIMNLDGFEVLKEEEIITPTDEPIGVLPDPKVFEVQSVSTPIVDVPVSKAPPPDPISVDFLSSISRVHPQYLREAGFSTFAQIRKEFKTNGGKKILAIKGIGRHVLSEIREAVYAHV